MNFGARLRARREELHLKQGELGRLLGVTGSAVGNYENGVSYPRTDILFRAFDVLGCDANYLFQDYIKSNMPISVDELRLLDKLRRLDEHGRKMVTAALECEIERLSAPAQAEAEKTIPLYLTPAAAGYASPAFGDDYVDYRVPITSPADFAVKIQGDSMEPYIADGSTVLVKRQTDLRPGDVGLFFVDDDMKCKQFYEDDSGNIYLLSLNRDRADADVTIWASSGITVWCFGKVILDSISPDNIPEK